VWGAHKEKVRSTNAWIHSAKSVLSLSLDLFRDSRICNAVHIELGCSVGRIRSLHSQRAAHSVGGVTVPDLTLPRLRSNLQNLLSVPQTRLKTRGDWAFEAVAPKLWNALAAPRRFADSTASFKLHLKTYPFTLAFGWFEYSMACFLSSQFIYLTAPSFTLYCRFFF